MKEDYLSAYNDGFIPGPQETEEEFNSRILKVKKLLENPKKHLSPFNFKGAFFRPLKGCAALFIPKRTSFLFASQTYIVECEDKTLFPLIKRPSRFSSFFVSSKEVINHELIHAKRVMFDDPIFEEIIAFRTSKSKLKRYFSPMISSQKDILIFILSALFAPISLFPMLLVSAFYLLRHVKRYKLFNLALKNLKTRCMNPEEMICALTDQEIFAIAKNKWDEISLSSFKWKFLQSLFGRVK